MVELSCSVDGGGEGGVPWWSVMVGVRVMLRVGLMVAVEGGGEGGV